MKQAPRAWNSWIDKYLHERNFIKCPYEPALYIKAQNNGVLVVWLYVDDLIFIGSNPSMFNEFKKEMTKEFEMIDIRLTSLPQHWSKQEDKGIFITQEGYAKKVIEKFKMDDSYPVNTLMECGINLSNHKEGEIVNPTLFKSLVWSLQYLTCTRPNVLYAVGVVSHYMENPTTTHLEAAKRILQYIQYIKGTTNFGLYYSISDDHQLVGYSDCDWSGDVDDCKSTTYFAFLMIW